VAGVALWTQLQLSNAQSGGGAYWSAGVLGSTHHSITPRLQ